MAYIHGTSNWDLTYKYLKPQQTRPMETTSWASQLSQTVLQKIIDTGNYPYLIRTSTVGVILPTDDQPFTRDMLLTSYPCGKSQVPTQMRSWRLMTLMDAESELTRPVVLLYSGSSTFETVHCIVE